MGDLDRHAALGADTDGFGYCFQDGLALAADVGSIDPVIAGDYPAQINDLVCPGEAAGRIDQPGGQAKSAGFQRLDQQQFHALQLGPSRGTVIVSHHRHAECRMACQGGNVDRQAPLLQGIQVLPEGAPLPGDFRRAE
jgi:hypothetical protein